MLSQISVKTSLLVLICLSYATAAIIQDVDTTITIPLNKTITSYNNKEIYGEFIKLNGSTTVKVNFTDIGANISFVVFQVHSQYNNVTLYKNKQSPSTQVTGTNIGLVSIVKPVPNDTFYIWNPNINTTVRVYISVHGYNSTDPYPGGCNMEFPVDITPYLIVRTHSAYIMVDGAPPSTDPDCSSVLGSRVAFYMMYLPEQTYYADDYFSGIRRMMTIENILDYGVELPATQWVTRRMLSAYPGIGVVFVAVAWSLEGYSVYVPNHSYGCEPVDENGCAFSDDMVSQLFCAALFFIGLFVSFFGHRFFKTEMFLAGFFGGYILSYILITIMDDSIDLSALVGASVLSGIFFGAIWLLFWWLYGLPVLAVLLPTLNLGFLLASILYYRVPTRVVYLQSDFNFWAVFIMVMCLTAVVLIPVAYAANIICCAVLGAFTTAFAFDYVMGSSLKYIFINTVRRAVVPVFNKAVLEPPFLWREIVVTLLWVMVALLGWSFQIWHNRGRPPFPPPPRNTREAAPESFSSYGSVTAPSWLPIRNNATYPYQTRTPDVARNYNERTSLLQTPVM